jgi:hypothetical protein
LADFVSDLAAKAGIVSACWLAPVAPRGGGLDLASLAGGLLGGKSEVVSTFASQLTKVGFSADSAKAFLPVALGLLKDNVSLDTMKQIEGTLPGFSDLSGGLEGADTRGLL